MQAFEATDAFKNMQGPFLASCEIEGRPRSFFETLHRNEGALIYFLRYLKA